MNNNYRSINPDNIYKASEVAEILRISNFTIHRLIRKGDIKASKYGRSYAVLGSHLREFIDHAFISRGRDN